MTVTYEEIYILIDGSPITVTAGDSDGVLVDVDATTVAILDDSTDIVLSPQETTLLIADVGVQGPPGPSGIPEEDVPYDLEVDDTSTPSSTYIGQADPGTASSAATWRIKKIVESGTGTSVDWADGVATFTKVWDDRLTYTYGP
jgi:hypothetical protein